MRTTVDAGDAIAAPDCEFCHSELPADTYRKY
jgi:hypothetical protein